VARLLYRLGRNAFNRRWLFLLGWIAVVALSGFAAVTMSGETSRGMSIPGTPAQNTIDRIEREFPEADAGGAVARVVFASPDGETLETPANRRAVESVTARLGESSQVAGVSDPFSQQTLSKDGKVAFSQVTYTVARDALSDETRTALERITGDGRKSGLEIEVGGDGFGGGGESSITEVLGIGVAAVVLLITFGAIVAAGLPLLTAFMGAGLGLALITAATGIWEIDESTSTLALMLGLAVGIDYALFVVSRYRQELKGGREPDDAIGMAVGTAGTAVVFAGLTVIIALAGLAVVGVPFLTQMGLGAAATVAIAVLLALTLLPALVGFAGDRVLSRRDRKSTALEPSAGNSKPGAGLRWARLVTSRPLPILAVALTGLVVMAIPATELRLGLPDEGTEPADSSPRLAYDLLSSGFGPGFNGPLTVAVDTAGSGEPREAIRYATELARDLPNVAAVSPARLNDSGTTAVMMVTPETGPTDTATKDLVSDLRGTSGELQEATGATLGVTGVTAINIDFSDKLASALFTYLLVVMGLALLLLTLVFRSIVIPVKATLGFLLTVGATFGAVVAVFQWGWLAGLLGVEATGPIVSFMPIFLIGIVFGLAMDYEVFLVTRMRERHSRGETPVDSILDGFNDSARVVTAAAIIMISVFGGFALAPDPTVKMMGFALAAAVFFDAFIVRMTIVPAVMALMGKATWWMPDWLDRLMPNVDIEGESLKQSPEPHRILPGAAPSPATVRT
jgi:RND superfamily putative drug exporter